MYLRNIFVYFHVGVFEHTQEHYFSTVAEEEEEACLLSLKPVFYVSLILIFLLILFFIYLLTIYLFTFVIMHRVCIVSVEYVRSTMQIGRSHLCDYFFITYFQYEIMNCE